MEYIFDTEEQLRSELLHHQLIDRFYATPKIISRTGTSVTYERIKSPTVSELLYQNQTTSLKPLYEKMLHIPTKQADPQGGTRMFFSERKTRLYEISSSTHYPITINHTYKPAATPTHLIQAQLLQSLDPLRQSLSHISNGDFHERNIFANYIVIDYEGAGYNSILADSATFIFHTLFAGPYFGPKYGKWASLRTKVFATLHAPIKTNSDNLEISLSTARKTLVDEHLSLYLNQLPAKDIDFYKKISELIAYRLATTFHFSKMAHQDQRAILSLIQLFLDHRLNLPDKLNVLTKG